MYSCMGVTHEFGMWAWHVVSVQIADGLGE